MIFREMSKYNVIFFKTISRIEKMNLHEECLLKYLLNTTNLFDSTEMLKLNNSLIEKSISKAKKLVTPVKRGYSINRI